MSLASFSHADMQMILLASLLEFWTGVPVAAAAVLDIKVRLGRSEHWNKSDQALYFLGEASLSL